jgi:hypothetical protein
MHLFRETFLLFGLNMLDALLTLIWVRTGTASEANDLMASFLEVGDYAFFLVKLGMGTITAIVLLKYGYKPIAKPLVTFAVTVYVCLMGVHLLTGLAAFGYLSETFLHDVGSWTQVVFAAYF